MLYTPTSPLLESVFLFLGYYELACSKYFVFFNSQSVFRSSATSTDITIIRLCLLRLGVFFLLLALKMMRRNVCFLNYQMLKEPGNSRDKYGTKDSEWPKKKTLWETQNPKTMYIYFRNAI